MVLLGLKECEMTTTSLRKSIAYHQRAEQIARLINSGKQEEAIQEYQKFSAIETVNFASEYPEATARIIWVLMVYYKNFPKGKTNG